ncbi:MAG: zinc transporter ZntB [Rhodospirillaceae bacterium]|nr:zinc transporter ZntB [Rhodospirillaceae bacterium]
MENGLKYSCDFDGQGGASAIGWAEINTPIASGKTRWLHFLVEEPGSETWLRSESGLDPITCDALLAENTRPRVSQLDDGLLVILRGVNLNPAADPEDMVGIRILIQAERIISLRIRKLKTTEEIQDALEKGIGPKNSGDFIAHMVEGLTNRMEPVIENIDDEIGIIEENIFSSTGDQTPDNLASLRYALITLIRYISPQREALNALKSTKVNFLDDEQRQQIGEAENTLLRYVEDMGAMRDRASIIYDEIRTRLQERMGKTMYLLTIITALLLPPSLIAGILGINVGGMPGVESPWAFSIVVAIVVVLCGFELWLLKRLKWI